MDHRIHHSTIHLEHAQSADPTFTQTAPQAHDPIRATWSTGRADLEVVGSQAVSWVSQSPGSP